MHRPKKHCPTKIVTVQHADTTKSLHVLVTAGDTENSLCFLPLFSFDPKYFSLTEFPTITAADMVPGLPKVFHDLGISDSTTLPKDTTESILGSAWTRIVPSNFVKGRILHYFDHVLSTYSRHKTWEELRRLLLDLMISFHGVGGKQLVFDIDFSPAGGSGSVWKRPWDGVARQGHTYECSNLRTEKFVLRRNPLFHGDWQIKVCLDGADTYPLKAATWTQKTLEGWCIWDENDKTQNW